MGRVFKARHQLMDRVVALKIVLPVCATSKNSRKRFFREIKIVGMLDHPNVVRAFDADQHDGSPYIVMEYLEGEDLERNLQRRGILPPADVIRYAAQAAGGWPTRTRRGSFTGTSSRRTSSSPDAGVVKVLDLGLGDFVGVSNEAVSGLDTDEGFAVGTTDYMSPEQLNAAPVDARTDLFSLGCTMYRLLTGRFAFPGSTQMDRLVRTAPGTACPDLRGAQGTPRAARRRDGSPALPETGGSLRLRRGGRPGARRIDARLGAPGREARVGSTGSWNSPPTTPAPQASEPPIDWSLVESALGTKRERAPDRLASATRTCRPRPAVAPSAASILTAQNLEEDGDESGRTVQAEYRKEVIQLNRELVGPAHAGTRG